MHVELQLVGDPVARRRAAHAGADAGHRALRPGRHRRHRHARDRPHRAAQLDHELRVELPRRGRLLRRGFPLALHAGSRRRLAPQAAALDHARRADGEGVRRGHEHRGPAAAVHHAPRHERPAARRRALGLGARSLQPDRSPRTDQELVSPDMDAVLGRAADDPRAEPRRRLRAPPLPAAARRQHGVPRLRHPDLRDRAARRHRPGPRRRAVRDRVGLGSLCRAPAGRRAPVLLTAGTSAPARTATSSISSAC